MIGDLLDDDRTYQDMPKSQFLHLLDNAFMKLSEEENTGLTAHSGTCGNEECINAGKSGFCFTGNKTKHHINLIIEEENGKVTDIYECNGFHCPTKDLQYKFKVKV